jgi:hypothetical protein
MRGGLIMRKPNLPPVTDAHRLAAFAAMHWDEMTYETAIKFDTRRRVIECRAHHIRTQEWLRTQERAVEPELRCIPGVDGHPLKWTTQLTLGALQPVTQTDFISQPPL